MLGDRLPDSVAAYYAALDEGAFEQAAAALSEDVVYAVPRPGAHEEGARNVVEGRQSLREYFERRGVRPHRHRILLSAVEGSSCLLEGVTEEATIGRALRTFMASLQLGAQDVRCRWRRAGSARTSARPTGASAPAPTRSWSPRSRTAPRRSRPRPAATPRSWPG